MIDGLAEQNESDVSPYRESILAQIAQIEKKANAQPPLEDEDRERVVRVVSRVLRAQTFDELLNLAREIDRRNRERQLEASLYRNVSPFYINLGGQRKDRTRQRYPQIFSIIAGRVAEGLALSEYRNSLLSSGYCGPIAQTLSLPIQDAPANPYL